MKRFLVPALREGQMLTDNLSTHTGERVRILS